MIGSLAARCALRRLFQERFKAADLRTLLPAVPGGQHRSHHLCWSGLRASEPPKASVHIDHKSFCLVAAVAASIDGWKSAGCWKDVSGISGGQGQGHIESRLVEVSPGAEGCAATISHFKLTEFVGINSEENTTTQQCHKGVTLQFSAYTLRQKRQNTAGWCQY